MKDTLLFGPYGAGALKNATALTEYGANAVWFHGFDEEAFARCQETDIIPNVEFKTFRADFKSRPDLIPIGRDGKPIRFGSLVQGVCLSRLDFLQETEDNLISGVKTYSPHGIWLDYLTFGGWFESPDPDLQESCFCPNCIADFCEATGIDADTPDEILSQHQSDWTLHKTKKIAGFAAHYAQIIRQHRPECIVGAYMCPWTPAEYDRALTRIFAQDYSLLAPSIDVFTPLIYCAKSGRPADWGKTFMESSSQFIPDSSKVQLILDFLDFPESLTALSQSKRPSWGVQVFAGAEVFARPESARTFGAYVEEMRKRWESS